MLWGYHPRHTGRVTPVSRPRTPPSPRQSLLRDASARRRLRSNLWPAPIGWLRFEVSAGSKLVFQVHGSDTSGAVVFRRKLRRDQALAFLSTFPGCVIAMEACASAHYWAREIALAGHETRLIPPAYVKPFVKRQKNDMADAEAICEAAQRPTMRFVAVKSEEAPGGRGDLPHPRLAGPAADAGDQRAWRPHGRVRACGAAGGGSCQGPDRGSR